MSLLPTLPILLASVSTDLAKVWLDRKGWPAATEVLLRHGLVPTSDWGKKVSALGLMLTNGILDWHMAENTPVARFTKDLLRDMPSELIARLWSNPGETIQTAGRQSPLGTYSIFQMEPADRAALLERIRNLDHADQFRIRTILGKLDPAQMAVLAKTPSHDLQTIMDILAPTAPVRTHQRRNITAFLHRIAEILVPNLGRTH